MSDPCDIRKKHARNMENLGKVLDLDKNVINGYSTFNTIAVYEKNKQVRLVDTKVYSNREARYVTQKELELYHKGKLQSSKIKTERQRAEEIKHLIANFDPINLSRLTREQLRK